MFAGDAVFPVNFEHPGWQNGFEHDQEEAAHRPFPSIWRVMADGAAFRYVPVFWDY